MLTVLIERKEKR